MRCQGVVKTYLQRSSTPRRIRRICESLGVHKAGSVGRAGRTIMQQVAAQGQPRVDDLGQRQGIWVMRYR